MIAVWRAANGLARGLDERFGVAGFARRTARKVFPDQVPSPASRALFSRRPPGGTREVARSRDARHLLSGESDGDRRERNRNEDPSGDSR
jgi:hypothetical protein